MPRLSSVLLLCLSALLTGPVGVALAAPSGQVVVSFQPAARGSQAAADALRHAGVQVARTGPGATVVGRVAAGRSRAGALRRLRRQAAVAWAAPAYRARAAEFSDPGTAARASRTGGWSAVQWDLTGPFGIGAPAAWASARASGGDGGHGVVVGVLDTGVAYADRGRWRRSPDLPRQRFVRGYDFVDGDPLPDDENGHGTFVASEIAAAAGNGYGMVGVAYKARIMPIRVLDSYGEGSSYRVALGIRWAVDHGADVLNVSIELADDFGPISLTAAPDVRSALRYARRRGVTVVGAAGNAADPAIPAARFADLIIQVGGSTEHGCLASYSNSGPGMDVVAPGGGDDAAVPGDPRCRPGATDGRPIAQVTFDQKAPRRFYVPGDYEGTSMAAPHVTGVVALMLAARTLGTHPSPLAVAARLRDTARPLGSMRPDGSAGPGLLDAAAALSAPRS